MASYCDGSWTCYEEHKDGSKRRAGAGVRYRRYLALQSHHFQVFHHDSGRTLAIGCFTGSSGLLACLMTIGLHVSTCTALDLSLIRSKSAVEQVPRGQAHHIYNVRCCTSQFSRMKGTYICESRALLPFGLHAVLLQLTHFVEHSCTA